MNIFYTTRFTSHHRNAHFHFRACKCIILLDLTIFYKNAHFYLNRLELRRRKLQQHMHIICLITFYFYDINRITMSGARMYILFRVIMQMCTSNLVNTGNVNVRMSDRREYLNSVLTRFEEST